MSLLDEMAQSAVQDTSKSSDINTEFVELTVNILERLFCYDVEKPVFDGNVYFTDGNKILALIYYDSKRSQEPLVVAEVDSIGVEASGSISSGKRDYSVRSRDSLYKYKCLIRRSYISKIKPYSWELLEKFNGDVINDNFYSLEVCNGIVTIGKSLIVDSENPILIDKGLKRLTITGKGDLVLASYPFQPCIGTRTDCKKMSGYFKPCMGSLQEVVIDSVNVVCIGAVKNFSIGYYGYEYCPKITLINGGSILCPEVEGDRVFEFSDNYDGDGYTQNHPVYVIRN